MVKTVLAALFLAAIMLLATPVSASRAEQVLLAREETGEYHDSMHGHWTALREAAARKNPIPADRAPWAGARSSQP